MSDVEQADDLLDQDEVATLCRVGRKTIANWVYLKREGFPAGFKIGRGRGSARYWRRGKVVAFIELREKEQQVA